MSDVENKTPDLDKAPKFEGEYDPERASKLIANLRRDISELKTELADVRKLADKLPELEAALADAKADNEAKASQLAKNAKEKLLAEHGIGTEYAALLTGDDETAWGETVKLLARLRTGAKQQAPKPGTVTPGMPDPVVNSKSSKLAGEAERAEAARKLFGH